MKSTNLLAALLLVLTFLLAANAQSPSNTAAPTAAPTGAAPTAPTAAPTAAPTGAAPTAAPTAPTGAAPTAAPTQPPTPAPTAAAPTGAPAPTAAPAPTGAAPTGAPAPTAAPAPTGAAPTGAPAPTAAPAPTGAAPTGAPAPTAAPAPTGAVPAPTGAVVVSGNQGPVPAPIFAGNQPPSVCGDGVVGGNEKCEPSVNGPCCNSRCQWATVGTPCNGTALTLVKAKKSGANDGIDCVPTAANPLYYCSQTTGLPGQQELSCLYPVAHKCSYTTIKKNKLKKKQGFCRILDTEPDKVKCSKPSTRNPAKLLKKSSKIAAKKALQ